MRKKQEELEVLKAQIRNMALGNEPGPVKGLESKNGVSFGKRGKRRKKIDLSEMEKENLKVLEDKKNLAEDLKLKEER